MEYGLIGEHLGHSFSPAIHSMLAPYSYELQELERNSLEAFFRARDFRGINVTIPYKEAVIPYLDEVDPVAEEIGAVNTVLNRNGKLCGYNTDILGMTDMIRHADIALAGKKVAILGTGGTSKTAKAVSMRLGAAAILQVSRRGGSAMTYEELYRDYGDIDILINTTPVGMYPEIFASPTDLDRFTNLSAVIDVVFNPIRTRLIIEAQKRGYKTATGLFMLVSQAARASELFIGCENPAEKTEKIFHRIEKSKENIVLIGMPASGKTTVGRLLSRMTDRIFVDTDEMIEREAGIPIQDIFKKFGEAVFREMEAKAIRSIASDSGKVIATGGGSILREENANALRMNGRLYFIDRPLSELVPTDSRPTASTKEAIECRYKERYPMYCRFADKRIDGAGDAATVAKKIMEEHMT